MSYVQKFLQGQVGKLIEIYTTYAQYEVFRVGYVQAVNGELYSILSVDENGLICDVEIGRISQLYRVGYDTEYLKKLTSLHTQSIPKDLIDVPNIFAENMNEVLNRLMLYETKIEIIASGCSEVTHAIIQDVGEDWFVLREFSESGKEIGKELRRSEDISRLHLPVDTITNITC